MDDWIDTRFHNWAGKVVFFCFFSCLCYAVGEIMLIFEHSIWPLVMRCVLLRNKASLIGENSIEEDEGHCVIVLWRYQTSTIQL